MPIGRAIWLALVASAPYSLGPEQLWTKPGKWEREVNIITS